MKTALAIALALLMPAALAGCSGNVDAETPTTAEVTTGAAATIGATVANDDIAATKLALIGPWVLEESSEEDAYDWTEFFDDGTGLTGMFENSDRATYFEWKVDSFGRLTYVLLGGLISKIYDITVTDTTYTEQQGDSFFRYVRKR